MLKNIYIFLLIGIIKGNNNYNIKIISHDYVLSNNRPTLTFFVNNDKKSHYFFINNFQSIPIITNTFTDKSEFNCSKEIKSFSYMNHYSCSFCLLDLEILGHQLNHLPFCVSDYRIKIPDKGISFSYHHDDNSYSFIHQLYNNKLIDHLIFAFEQPEKFGNGTLHFGGVSSIKYKNKGFCRVRDNQTFWGCDLTGIKFNNKFYQLNVYSIFHSGFGNSYIPSNIYALFKKLLFEEKLKKGMCTEHEDINSGHYIKCNKSIYESIETVEFDFGTMKFSLPLPRLYDPYYPEWVFTFQKNPYSFYSKNTEFIFGFDFINSFNLTSFNYENKRIEFYSDVIDIKMIQTKYLYEQYYIFIIIIGVFCFAILFLLYIKIRVSYNI